MGFSAQGYRDIEAAYDALLGAWGSPPEVVVFGGDRGDDGGVGSLVKLVKDRLEVRLVAVIKATLTHGLEDHVDSYVKYSDEDWWGGVDNEGRLRGATAVYLDDEFGNSDYGIISVGGGKIAREEVNVAREKGILCVYAKAPNREGELGEVDGLLL